MVVVRSPFVARCNLEFHSCVGVSGRVLVKTDGKICAVQEERSSREKTREVPAEWGSGVHIVFIIANMTPGRPGRILRHQHVFQILLRHFPRACNDPDLELVLRAEIKPFR